MISGHVDTEELYFEIQSLYPSALLFFALILCLKKKKKTVHGGCKGKCSFYIGSGPPFLSVFLPLWEEVKRRRQDQLLWRSGAGFRLCRCVCAAHMRRTCGKGQGRWPVSSGREKGPIHRVAPLVCLKHVAAVSSVSLQSCRSSFLLN